MGPGQPTTAPKDDGKKKKKGGGGKTVSSVYLVSLTELMTTLHNCAPHFVRCLVPNTHKKLLEAQCKDTGSRADEAEVNALKGGRKAMIKMETRIRELESELDAETRRNSDVMKNLRKAERSIKELTFAGDEDKKNHERMQSLIDQLQGKVKSYKRQIEEAEEIAALNLAKYRKVAGALGDATAAADAAEQDAAMRKARARSASCQ